MIKILMGYSAGGILFKLAAVDAEGLFKTRIHPEHHRHFSLFLGRHPVGGAVEVETAFTEGFAMVGDINECGIDAAGRIFKHADQRRQNVIRFAHAVVVSVHNRFAAAALKVCIGAFRFEELSGLVGAKRIGRTVRPHHVKEEYRRTVGGQFPKFAFQFREEYPVTAFAVGAVLRIRRRRTGADARTGTFAARLIVNSEHVGAGAV